MIKYVFFDVAGTLVYKPKLFYFIQRILQRNHHHISQSIIQHHYSILSKNTTFPAKTTKSFYDMFNANLLQLLGIQPSPTLLIEIYNECNNLHWEAFPDTSVLRSITLPVGIISNWDDTLNPLLASLFSVPFWKVYSSSDIGLAKPDIRMYQHVVKDIGCAPSEIVYIGDSLDLDIIPASTIGLKTILLDRNNEYIHFKGPKISSLSEIWKTFGSGADF